MAASPDKVARLVRRMQPEPAVLRAPPPPPPAFEVRGQQVLGYIGDAVVVSMVAPSGPAARAIAKALRQLQHTRGSVF